MIESLSSIESTILRGGRISREDATWLYTQASMDDLSRLATVSRGRFHRHDEATYLIMAIINYTNVCVAKCDYCAFYRLPHQEGTYLLNDEEIAERIEAVIALGGTMIGFNGGFHPKLKIEHYAKTFANVRRRFGSKIQFYGMTVAEFVFAARLSKLSYSDAADILRNHGSEWITGGGAEILDDQFRRRHSPGKFSVAEYYRGQKAILDAGMGSTATMVIGFDETLEERLNHLELLRNFQDATGRKMPSFLCWTYKPYATELGGSEIAPAEYLRWLAVSRIFLDNFVNIRTSVLTKNEDALLGLRYGANDFDLPTEDEVTQKAGAQISLDFKHLLKFAQDLGFKTIHREPFGRLQLQPELLHKAVIDSAQALA